MLVAVALAPISAVAALAASASALDPPSLGLYVAAVGDDSGNDCETPEAPCRTVVFAVAQAHAAISGGAVDVAVHVGGGTYEENVVIGAVTAGHSLRLVGAGAATTVIDGLGTASVPASAIAVTSGVVGISALTVTGAVAMNGAGIYNGSAALTVSDSVVSGNTAIDTVSARPGGGGIYNDSGTVTLTRTAVSGNNASRYGGAVYNNTTGTLTVSDSTVSDNAGFYSGGVYNRGTLAVEDTTVSGNTATNNFGGGLTNVGGSMTVSGSTLSGNTATTANTGKGGAIYNSGGGTVLVTNSTLFGNRAHQGGGISNGALLTVTHSTLASNAATSDGAVPNRGGGIYWEGGSITVSNSILSASRCSAVSALADGGYNVGDSSCFYIPAGTSVANSTTIGLSPLAANGSTGPHTMAISADSSAHHLVPACTGTDQRGLDRPGFGGTAACDAGAYELQGVAPTVTTDPESQSYPIGSDATFTAAATGTPAPSVQWQVNTGSTWADVADATDTTLTVPGVTRAMNGREYRAVFTNGVSPDATTDAATLTVPVGALDHLVLSPPSVSIRAGSTQAFTAEAFDAYGNSLGDVTATTELSGAPGLSCTGTLCTTSAAGTHTVTGTHAGAVTTATIRVVAGPLSHLALSPASASVVAGDPQVFTAQGLDRFGNSLGDVTSATTFTGSSGLSCVATTCSSPKAGTYTVTGSLGLATGSATLVVSAGVLDHLVLSPGVASVVAGDSQAFTAEGFDAVGNSLGDVTRTTEFVGSPGLSCVEASCGSSEVDTYTVTGTHAGATGTATVTVTAGPLDHLVLSPGTASIVAGDVQAFAAEGFDSFGNSHGDLTSTTVFSGLRGVQCTAELCSSSRAGTHTVTGTHGAATGSAELTVHAKRQQATVVRVVDGDTVLVRLLPRGPRQRVQLIGIDSPDVRPTNECWGPQASRAASDILRKGTRIRLVVDRTQDLEDRKGRLLRYVRTGGRDVNRTLVARGHARVSVDQDRPFKRIKQYRTSQSRAKQHGNGLWGHCAAGLRFVHSSRPSGGASTSRYPTLARATVQPVAGHRFLRDA